MPSAAEQNEEIPLKDVGHSNGNNGVDVIHSSLDNIRHGELCINGVGSIEERYVGGRTLP